MRARKTTAARIFDTDRRIRLGIWGLGRGMSFFKTCEFLNIDVVAGCDYNAHMRENFKTACPGAFVTDDAEAFLGRDFDAVLLATFCPAHALHAIQCLQAGKHVLSEVTAFFSPAEGVRLVEEVERRKRVYNLAENYPYSAANMWLASRWREGLFGDLMYAEYEYVHECRSLAYTYIDGLPVMPGHAVHNWRSWFNFHYYCTHSLGPVMAITGTRPVAVETFPCKPRLAGYLRGRDENGSMTPSLIQMSNGGVVRNLMGATTSDTHSQRMWGTRGAFEIGRDGVRLRLGAAGNAPMMAVKPEWEGLGELAAQTGHGGGDFWTLYYFAREILTGEKAPFDIYSGCDVTLPGILARRSSLEGGKPLAVPDFRKKADRDRYRGDDARQEGYDAARGVFGGLVPRPREPAARFSSVMKEVVAVAPLYRAYADWRKVRDALADPAQFLPVAEKLLLHYPKLADAYRDARAIIAAHPRTDGAQVLREMLEIGEADRALDPAFLPALKREVAALRRKFAAGKPVVLDRWKASALLPVRTAVGRVAYPGKGIRFADAPYDAQHAFCDIRSRYGERRAKDGLVYGRACFTARKAGAGTLRIGADGPFKVFVNRKAVYCNPRATNPVESQMADVPVSWRRGANEIVLALRTSNGQAWGFNAARAQG